MIRQLRPKLDRKICGFSSPSNVDMLFFYFGFVAYVAFVLPFTSAVERLRFVHHKVMPHVSLLGLNRQAKVTGVR